MKKKFVIVIILTFVSFYCEEKIPQGPPKVQVIEAELYVPFNRKVFPHPTNYWTRYSRPESMTQAEWEYATDSAVRFRIKVNNIFDETIDGLKWIDVKLHLWSTNYSYIDYTFSYTNFSEDSTLIVLHPGKSYYVYTADSLVWNQTDESGNCIFDTEPFHMYFIRLDSTFSKELDKWEYFCDTTYVAWVDTVVKFDLPVKMKAQAAVKIFKNYEPIISNIYHFEIHYFFPQGMTIKEKCPLEGGGG